MEYTHIINAVIVLGATSIVFGLLLAIASRVFAVEKDEREEQVLNLLPGANCGGCGYAGCAAYAKALAEGTTSLGKCGSCSKENTEEISQILGVSADEGLRVTALVRCSGGIHTKKRFEYSGLEDCAAAAKVAGGPLACAYGCLGMGSCVKACPFDAIHIDPELGVARVDHNKCTGCMTCASACPRGLIISVPYFADVTVMCASKEKGASLRKVCDIGCIGCKMCEKVCEHDAIHVVDNLAAIDYSKCIGCGKCAEKCPRHLITDAKLNERMEASGILVAQK